MPGAALSTVHPVHIQALAYMLAMAREDDAGQLVPPTTKSVARLFPISINTVPKLWATREQYLIPDDLIQSCRDAAWSRIKSACVLAISQGMVTGSHRVQTALSRVPIATAKDLRDYAVSFGILREHGSFMAGEPEHVTASKVDSTVEHRVILMPVKVGVDGRAVLDDGQAAMSLGSSALQAISAPRAATPSLSLMSSISSSPAIPVEQKGSVDGYAVYEPVETVEPVAVEPVAHGGVAGHKAMRARRRG